MSDRPQDAVPPVDSQATRPQTPTERPSRTIGPYRLLQLLGEGGMGEVWLAEQTQPVRRRVALKLIKAGMDTAQVVARFEAERQALALMDHPAIAKVFDGGSTPEGRPYFAMEYVQGEPITDLLRPAAARDPGSGSSCSCRSARASSTRTRRASSTAT